MPDLLPLLKNSYRSILEITSLFLITWIVLKEPFKSIPPDCTKAVKISENGWIRWIPGLTTIPATKILIDFKRPSSIDKFVDWLSFWSVE